MNRKSIYLLSGILLAALSLIPGGCKGHHPSSEGSPADSLTLQEQMLRADAEPQPQAETTVPAPQKGAEYDRSGFVVVTDSCPDVLLDIRYFSTYNFTGRRIPGYEEPIALLSREAASALRAVSDDVVSKGYRLKIFDAYRPQCAVDEFKRWSRVTDDTLMRSVFYPEYPKNRLFAEGFIASRSGHSRGSTVDLTLVDMQTEQELDMGTSFDYMGRASYTTLLPGEDAAGHAPISEEQYRNRQILLQAMNAHGWRNYPKEWWHFTLRQEPYPHTFFNFPVRK